MSTLPIRDTTISETLVGAGIYLIVVVGLIHLINSPGDLEEGSYTGLLYLANFFGAILAAIGIYRGLSWGWSLGALVSVGAFAGFVISRTIESPSRRSGLSLWAYSHCWSRLFSWDFTRRPSFVPQAAREYKVRRAGTEGRC
jgi:hypothetical protein